MMDYVIFIPIIIVLLIIISFVIYALVNSNKKKETSASILDVNEVGVPSSSEFSYGYEKEETVVMNPVSEENANSEDLPDTSNNDIDITNSENKSSESEEN